MVKGLINLLKQKLEGLKRPSMSDADYELFTKYKNGEVLSEQDEYAVDGLAGVGLFCVCGFTTEGGTPRRTARITPIARRMLARERMKRHPVGRILYDFYCLHW